MGFEVLQGLDLTEEVPGPLESLSRNPTTISPFGN
jgi:hypothetical protein